MKIFVSGSCNPQNVFSLVDPSTFTEADFEVHVLAAFTCVYPDYHCIPFRGGFEFDGGIHEADLALIHKTLSHWFVLEVELASHSLHGHVVPQVRCFRYGRPLGSCIDYLCRFVPNLSTAQAESFLRYVPRAVAVVANRSDKEWASVLRGVDTQHVTVSVFSRGDGAFGHETDGSLYVPHTSLGFFIYSGPDRSLRLTKACGLEEGVIQIEDPYGIVGLWTVRAAGDTLWLTKNVGDPGIPHNHMLQVLKTHAGKITLKIPGG